MFYDWSRAARKSLHVINCGKWHLKKLQGLLDKFVYSGARKKALFYARNGTVRQAVGLIRDSGESGRRMADFLDGSGTTHPDMNILCLCMIFPRECVKEACTRIETARSKTSRTPPPPRMGRLINSSHLICHFTAHNMNWECLALTRRGAEAEIFSQYMEMFAGV